MGWVRVDDHFDEHPDMAKVGPLGWGFWLAGLAYCNRNLTDGFVPRGVARSLADFEVVTPAGEVVQLSMASGMAVAEVHAAWVIDLLLGAGLWEPTEGGYLICRYLDFQPSREKVLADRAARKSRVDRFRAERNADCNAVSDSVSAENVTPLRRTDPNPNPNPTSKGKQA